jgi:ADP-ribosylation factor GTPase-activating protein 2/3
MKTITQESRQDKIITSTEAVSAETDVFFSLDEFYSVYANSKPSRNEEIIVVAEPELPKRLAPSIRSANTKNDTKTSSIVEGEAQKKFGSAKAISSEQYFQDSTSDNAVSQNYKRQCLIFKKIEFLFSLGVFSFDYLIILYLST